MLGIIYADFERDYNFAETLTLFAFAVNTFAASLTIWSTIVFAGRTSSMRAETRPMSHGRVAGPARSGCFSISCSYGRIPFDVSSLISAWRLLFL